MVKTLNSSLALLGAIVLPFLMSSCGGDTHEKVADDAITEVEKLAEILSTVKDKASAESAASKIEKISKRMEAISERAKKLPDLSPEEEERLEEKYEKRMNEAMGKLMAANLGLMSKGKDVRETLNEAMEKFSPPSLDFGQ